MILTANPLTWHWSFWLIEGLCLLAIIVTLIWSFFCDDDYDDPEAHIYHY